MKRHQYEDFVSTPQNRVKGATMQRRFPVRLRDGPFHGVDVKMTFEVTDGFEIEWVGIGYGDPNWNDGQGYFIIGLSVLRQSKEIAEDGDGG